MQYTGFGLFTPLLAVLPVEAAELVRRLQDYEQNFRGESVRSVMLANSWVPGAMCVGYIAMVFLGPRFIKTPLPIRLIVALWNLFLSVFSFVGASVLVPYMFTQARDHGLEWTLCQHPEDGYFYNGPAGLWIALFILSKTPELVDTLLLVLQKKDVILLHWYHHFTVLLFCWYAYAWHTSAGIWYGAMNFTVHGIMYGYYFLTTFALGRKIAKPFGVFITALQILQMVAGVAISVGAYLYRHSASRTKECHTGDGINAAGLLMYLSYFALFTKLFYDYYVSDAGKKRREKKLSRSPAPAGEDAKAKKQN